MGSLQILFHEKQRQVALYSNDVVENVVTPVPLELLKGYKETTTPKSHQVPEAGPRTKRF